MLKFLEGLGTVNMPKPAKASKPWRPRLQRRHGLDMTAFVIFLRFGSLTEERVICRSREEIFRLTGVKPDTQTGMFRKWR